MWSDLVVKVCLLIDDRLLGSSGIKHIVPIIYCGAILIDDVVIKPVTRHIISKAYGLRKCTIRDGDNLVRTWTRYNIDNRDCQSAVSSELPSEYNDGSSLH